MSAGIRIRDAAGNVIIDSSQRLPRFIGTVSVAGTNGSITVSDFSQGTPFFILMDLNSTLTDIYTFKPYTPTVSISGNVLSWTYATAHATNLRASAIIMYGVY